jgi:dihydrolipoamide dehydrogenase
VIGGGVIGLEMGSVWGRLGAKVTIVEALPSILANMDSGVSKSMTKIMGQQGMDIQANTKVTGVTVSGNQATVTAQADGKTVEFKGDKVLVAVGRRAYTDSLGLDKIGVQTKPNGKVIVDDHYKTNVAGVYAIGDVVDGMMLAHKAEEEGVALAELIAGKPGHVNYGAIPNVVYTWPEVASVGLTEEECKTRGLEYNVGQFPFAANGRAACQGATEGFVKIIADKKTDRMLGVHIVGPTASELIAEVAIAFEFGASAEDIARSVHAHPTLAEVIKEAALAVDKRALHI